MNLIERLDNIYVLDTKMHGLDYYMSSFLVKGKELALVDTCMPNQFEALRSAINSCGFELSDISRIILTHCEHPDHAGCVTPVLKENPKAKVYVNAIGQKILLDPLKNIDFSKRVSPELLPRFLKINKDWQPVPQDRIQLVNDGDSIDLGNGEKLKVMFTRSHQPSGMILFESKNNGLFINDLVGNCFLDVDSHYPLSPVESDNIETVAVLKKLLGTDFNYLYLGHYGITDEPRKIISRAIDKLETILDFGKKYMLEGKPELISKRYYEFILPELEKLNVKKYEPVYQYAAKEHIVSQSKLFAAYCKEKFGS
jgi:glyoxylase-like metal-dependent hydrolase (beta-lactamase superfamily II)